MELQKSLRTDKMKRISIDEYKALRDELNMRIQLMNTHNLGMITAVFAVWAIAGVLFKDYIEILDDVTSYIRIAVTLYTFFIPLFIIIPIAIIMPLSVKSGDNLGQIMSLSAYIKLYAEMPSYMDDDGNKFFGWESLQKKEMERKLSDKFFNSEYLILSIISVCMFIFVSAIMFGYGIVAGFKDLYYILPILIVIALLGVIAIVFIARKSSTSLFLKHRDDYYKRYCDFAVQSGATTQKVIDDYNKYIEGGL